MRLLKYLIILLFAVIIAETGYLLFFKMKDTKSESTGTIVQEQTNPIKTSPPSSSNSSGLTLEDQNIQDIDTFYRNINPNMALDPKVIYSHIFYKKGVTQKSVIQNTHQGKITEIDRTKKPAFYGYYDTVLTIRIVSLEDPDIGITLNFSENDLKTLSVLVDIDDQLEAANPDILKVGDTIIVEDTIDATVSIPNENATDDGFLTKSWGFNRIKTQITKIN